jgi:hypothetical protein
MESKIEGIGIENPFTLKVGQVFTGFGIGCGVGIGVGRPLNLGIFLLFSSLPISFTLWTLEKTFSNPKLPKIPLLKNHVSLFLFVN